jgi:hypothetical protein
MEQMARLSPSADLRAGVMLLAGNLTATVKSLRSGDHITIKVVCKSKSDSGWRKAGYEEATHVFLSVPSAGGWSDKIGTYYPKTGRLFPVWNADPARVWAAKAVLLAACGEVPHRQAEITVADRCGRCGRQLTDPVSIERGIGPECYGRETGSHHEIRVPHVTVVATPLVKEEQLKLEVNVNA